jgi:hypothetical protein
MTTCEANECEALAAVRGYCTKHYQRLRKHGDLYYVPRRRRLETIEQRFLRLFTPGPRTECWPWRGYIAPEGYGRLWCSDRRRHVPAHRYSYEHYIGPVAPELVMDHLCRNRACVNPYHLEPVTDRVNVLRGIGPTAQFARSTVCQRGHEKVPANLYVRPDGTACCRRCVRMRENEQRRLKRAARVARGGEATK